MKISLALAAAVLAVPVIETSVAAATFTITYTGTVSSGYDETGVFGAADTDLTGQAFTAVYTLTSPLPGTISGDNGVSAFLYGGSANETPSPLSATVTISGTTFAVDGAYLAELYRYNGLPTPSSYDQVYHSVESASETSTTYKYFNLNNGINSRVSNFLASTDHTELLDYRVQSTDIATGSLYIYSVDYANSDPATNYAFALANLTADRITIAAADVAGVVPEPSTWAMLILGFGAVGAGMRGSRHRRVVMSYA